MLVLEGWCCSPDLFEQAMMWPNRERQRALTVVTDLVIKDEVSHCRGSQSSGWGDSVFYCTESNRKFSPQTSVVYSKLCWDHRWIIWCLARRNSGWCASELPVTVVQCLAPLLQEECPLVVSVRIAGISALTSAFVISSVWEWAEIPSGLLAFFLCILEDNNAYIKSRTSSGCLWAFSKGKTSSWIFEMFFSVDLKGILMSKFIDTWISFTNEWFLPAA